MAPGSTVSSDGRDPIPPDAMRRIKAAVDLLERTGVRQINIAYAHDTPRMEDAGWFMEGHYRGSRIICDEHVSPWDAADAMVTRILDGGKCTRCGRLTTTNPAGAWARDAHLIDGTPWSAQEQVAAGVCVWRLVGERWTEGCGGAGAGGPDRPPRWLRRGGASPGRAQPGRGRKGGRR